MTFPIESICSHFISAANVRVRRSEPTPEMKNRLLRICLIAGASIAIWIFLPGGTVSRDIGYHCDFTGSTKTWTRWLFLISTDYEYKVSPLETFVREKYPDELEHKWVRYSAVGKNIYGESTIFDCALPNALSSLDRTTLKLFVKQSPDKNVKELYDLLRRDNRDEIGLRIAELYDDSDRLWRNLAEQDGVR